MPKPSNRLNHRQERFCRAVAEGHSVSVLIIRVWMQLFGQGKRNISQYDGI